MDWQEGIEIGKNYERFKAKKTGKNLSF